MTKRLFIIFLIIALFGAAFFGTFVLRKPTSFIQSLSEIFSIPSLLRDQVQLKKENAQLKAQLLATSLGYSLPEPKNFIDAKVFSVNPFNVKNRIFIDKGFSNGVERGAAVLFSDSVLLGYVSKVGETQSEVITVFDPEFSLPVRIGSQEIDGLLEGGVSPRVGLIDKHKEIHASDEVYATSSDFPYGLLVGFVRDVSSDSSNAFLQATVELPYALLDVRDVFVMLQ